MTYTHLVDGVAVQVTEEENATVTGITVAGRAAKVRSKRDNILTTVVDPLVSNNLRWADLTAAKKAEWSQYRTDLLNVPQQDGFPHTVAWPTKPEGE
tara:strand:+ start:592 stop:882 length:291 start_codon:yes stop_codon:yes gene_type:complete